MAQLVEHILGKDEVPSSNLGSSSKKRSNPSGLLFFVSWSCYPIRIRFSRLSRKPVRIRHPKLRELAHEAQGARIFALRIPGFSHIYHPFGWFFVLESLLAIRIWFSRNARKPVRIRHPKFRELAHQAQGARIFASANTWVLAHLLMAGAQLWSPAASLEL